MQAKPGRQRWTYWLDRGATECAAWHGGPAPSLGVHFHAQDQWSFVLAGCRLFRIVREEFRVEAGQCLLVPAGIPHRGLPSDDCDVWCLNVYDLPLRGSRTPRVFPFSDLPDRPEAAGVTAQLDRWEQDQAGSRENSIAELGQAIADRAETIGEIASRHGLARESYTRAFARRFGMPPHAYRIVGRLNEAQVRLRSGESVAAVAAELGFADQSHFGRHFLRVFGVTPRVYRDDMR